MSVGIIAVGLGAAAYKEAYKIQQRDIDERSDAWDSIYGSVEQNITDYYTNLTPDKLIAADLQAEEAGFAYKDIDEVVNALKIAGIGRPIVRVKPLGNVKG